MRGESTSRVYLANTFLGIELMDTCELSNQEVFRICREQLLALAPDTSPQLIDELSLSWQTKYFAKGEILVDVGEEQQAAYLVVSGLVRAYYRDIEEDVSVNFIKEGEFATHYTGLEGVQRSKFVFRAIEPTLAVAMPYDYLRAMCQRSREGERLLRIMVELEYKRAFAHLETFLVKSSEERYRLFVREFGDILGRISVSDLASYLGISRQSLTLIRKRMLQND